ncbi:DUF2889 domain-containing protein [Aminipila terrae]|uniref:DUF2889 domain-containing protein n=1 Tax=Aminipila terrae TaxID=2697030 RepID=A0A6P1MKR5_9FIRM|nr:DUF2889 domain-containing protein [Aminipila terrae]QHI71585.1 DUF2889 domain-containing protein [Aminipila terrae]
MKLAAERNFKVNYYEKEEGKNLWIAESHLIDEPHDISVILEIDMDQMLIVDANIKFYRNPAKECILIEEIADRLVGLKVDHSFSQNAMKITMGPSGCPNIMTLLNISVPGILYYYYPYKIKCGEMTQEQFFEILREREKNACLAHTIIFSEEN